MPILSQKPVSTKEPDNTKQTDSPKIEHPKKKSTVVDTRYETRKSLITHIEGSPWTVLYYQQVVGRDEELSEQQLSQNSIYQQYIEIADLEIRVNDPLDGSQQDVEGNFEITGAATLYPMIIPNKGDMFLADIGDGREGVFTITEVERLTIFKESCYRVNYVLVAHSDPARREDLKRKSVKRTHFVKRLLEHGEDPIVVSEDYQRYLSLHDYRHKLIGLYFGNFYYKGISSLMVPDQECITYDPFLTLALTSTLDTNDTPTMRDVKNYSVEIPGLNRPLTLWDALLSFSIDMLPMVNEKMALVDSRMFGVAPQYEGVFFSNVEDVVYPIDRVDGCYPLKNFAAGGAEARDIRFQFKTSRLGRINEINKPRVTDDALKEPPLIHSVTKDDYYVFTEEFYFDQPGQSQFELLVRKALSGEKMERAILFDLAEASRGWGRLEKFYYIPILLLLIKMTLKGQ